MDNGAREAPGPPPPDPAVWSAELAARWARLAEELRRRLGLGVPLDPAVRYRFETQLGSDLSGAVLHRGELPAQLAAALGADALAAGSHVLGDARRLDPATRRGAALLGHELTHAGGAPGHASAPPVPPMRLRPPPGALPVRPPAPPPIAPPVALNLPAVQRAEPSGEAAAQSVEGGLLQRPARKGRRPVDVHALAERVYTRLVDALMIERERAPWSA